MKVTDQGSKYVEIVSYKLPQRYKMEVANEIFHVEWSREGQNNNCFNFQVYHVDCRRNSSTNHTASTKVIRQ